MKTSDILNKAAEIMMERGHCKQELWDNDGRVCLVGAYIIARCCSDAEPINRFFWHYPEYRYLNQVLGVCPDTWNDRGKTTGAMAIGVLHEAAILAKEQGD